MADESDVENALVDVIVADLYPNGPGGAGGPPYPTKVFPGWPVAAVLERDLREGVVCVSVYAMPGVLDADQIMDTDPGILVPATKGLTISGTTQAITITGTPAVTEYVTAVIEGNGYTYTAEAGDTAADVAAGLAAEMADDYPGVMAVGNVLTLAPGPDVEVRTGARALMGVKIHRQRQQIRVIVWARSPEERTAIAKRVDLAVKRVNVLSLADGTQALVTATGAGPNDQFQLEGIYRRDLILTAMFDTLDTYYAYEVTHVDLAIERMPAA